jgi:hypothetical protein
MILLNVVRAITAIASKWEESKRPPNSDDQGCSRTLLDRHSEWLVRASSDCRGASTAALCSSCVSRVSRTLPPLLINPLAEPFPVSPLSF